MDVLTGPAELSLETAVARRSAEVDEFVRCPARHAAAAGGFRSGKTVAGCLWALLLGQRTPGGLMLVGRLNSPALNDTTRRTFLELCPAEWVGDWKESQNRLIMTNGMEYIFRHLDLSDAALAGHIRGLVLSAFLVDQSEEISEGTYLTLVGRLSRRVDDALHPGEVMPTYGRLLFNPAGHDWNWQRFFDPHRSDKYKGNAGFVLPTDSNAANLPPEYLQDLENSYPTDWEQRFRYASFAEFSDQVYKEFDPRLHCWNPEGSFEVFEGSGNPPKTWKVLAGMDIGGTDPWAVDYAALGPGGNLYFFDEIDGAGILVSEIARRHKEIMQDRRLDGLAYDFENRQAYMELAEHGIHGSPARKEVMPGIFKVGQMIHPDTRARHPFTGSFGSPRIFVSERCRNLIRSLSTYRWAKDRGGRLTGMPAHTDSHHADAVRYLCHTFRPEGDDLPAKARWQNEDISELSRLYWYEREKKGEAKKAGSVWKKSSLHSFHRSRRLFGMPGPKVR